MMTGGVASGPLSARIQRIELSDFRAFPAVQPGIFDLGPSGCNLLLFGENGSGKSSLYRALRGLFAVSPEPATEFRNVFTEPPQTSVKVTLTDGTTLAWTTAAHPAASVLDTARRSAFLSHTRLIEMNTGQTQNDPPNLFDIAVESLLADFEATVSGGMKRTVGELWASVQEAYDSRIETKTGIRRPPGYTITLNTACELFNEGMRQALDQLELQAKTLLRSLLDVLVKDGMELVGLVFFGVKYDESRREIQDKVLSASVKFRSHTMRAPQNFLNEARQSALAIAIYLAARLVCVPKTDSVLKLLVLDDLLLSLDTSHRRPVLKALVELFADWQIILLTHDRYWFELARHQLGEDKWRVVEVYEWLNGEGLLVPLVRPVKNNMLEETLAQAKAFLLNKHAPAAANYARSACELALKRFCLKQNVKFSYFEDAKRPSLEALLEAAQKQVTAAGDTARIKVLKDLEHHKRYILNPYSHDHTVPNPTSDVEAAIKAVEELVKACGKTYP